MPEKVLTPGENFKLAFDLAVAERRKKPINIWVTTLINSVVGIIAFSLLFGNEYFNIMPFRDAFFTALLIVPIAAYILASDKKKKQDAALKEKQIKALENKT